MAGKGYSELVLLFTFLLLSFTVFAVPIESDKGLADPYPLAVAVNGVTALADSLFIFISFVIGVAVAFLLSGNFDSIESLTVATALKLKHVWSEFSSSLSSRCESKKLFNKTIERWGRTLNEYWSEILFAIVLGAGITALLIIFGISSPFIITIVGVVCLAFFLYSLYSIEMQNTEKINVACGYRNGKYEREGSEECEAALEVARDDDRGTGLVVLASAATGVKGGPIIANLSTKTGLGRMFIFGERLISKIGSKNVLKYGKTIGEIVSEDRPIIGKGEIKGKIMEIEGYEAFLNEFKVKDVYRNVEIWDKDNANVAKENSVFDESKAKTDEQMTSEAKTPELQRGQRGETAAEIDILAVDEKGNLIIGEAKSNLKSGNVKPQKNIKNIKDVLKRFAKDPDRFEVESDPQSSDLSSIIKDAAKDGALDSRITYIKIGPKDGDKYNIRTEITSSEADEIASKMSKTWYDLYHGGFRSIRELANKVKSVFTFNGLFTLIFKAPKSSPREQNGPGHMGGNAITSTLDPDQTKEIFESSLNASQKRDSELGAPWSRNSEQSSRGTESIDECRIPEQEVKISSQQAPRRSIREEVLGGSSITSSVNPNSIDEIAKRYLGEDNGSEKAADTEESRSVFAERDSFTKALERERSLEEQMKEIRERFPETFGQANSAAGASDNASKAGEVVIRSQRMTKANYKTANSAPKAVVIVREKNHRISIPTRNKVAGINVSGGSKSRNSAIRAFRNRKNSKKYGTPLLVAHKATAKSIKGTSKGSSRIKMFLREW